MKMLPSLKPRPQSHGLNWGAGPRVIRRAELVASSLQDSVSSLPPPPEGARGGPSPKRPLSVLPLPACAREFSHQEVESVSLLLDSGLALT